MKTKEEIALKHGFINGMSLHSNAKTIEKSLYDAMEEYSDQNCDLIRELYNKPANELKPLEEYYRKEHPKKNFYLPDRTKFYKWIRLKLEQYIVNQESEHGR